MPFSYLTFAQARSTLASRLQDPGLVYWNQPYQLDACIIESLRFHQSLTGSYKQKVTFSTTPNINFYDLPTILPAGNPVGYNVTDVEIINNVLACLLEPPLTYPTWTGTGQFTLTQLRQSLQNRLNRFLGDTGCRVTQQTLNVPAPSIDLLSLPDPVLDVRRAAWIQPSDNPPVFDVEFVDQVPLIGIQNGVNQTYTLPGPAPNPTSSLELTLNGQLLKQGFDYLLNNLTVQYLFAALVPTDIQRASYRYVNGVISGSLPTELALGRVDEWTSQAYSPAAGQNPNVPLTYSVFGTGPLQLRLIPAPLNEGMVDCLFVQAGPQVNLNPFVPVVLQVPDDLSPALKWGVLADMLGTDGPSRDYIRAQYAEQRYSEWVQIASLYPSTLTVDFNDVTGSVGSVFDMDFYNPNWQTQTGSPNFLGMAGRNLACVGPTPDFNGPYGIGLWTAANAPVTFSSPALRDASYIQVSRDQIDPVIDYAQHIASFQMGGVEFDGTGRLYENMIACGKMQNRRLSAVSFYRQQMQQPQMTSDLEVNRLVSSN